MSERSELVEIIHKPIDKVGNVFNPYVLANDIIDAIHNSGYAITPIDGDGVSVPREYVERAVKALEPRTPRLFRESARKDLSAALAAAHREEGKG